MRPSDHLFFFNIATHFQPPEIPVLVYFQLLPPSDNILLFRHSLFPWRFFVCFVHRCILILAEWDLTPWVASCSIIFVTNQSVFFLALNRKFPTSKSNPFLEVAHFPTSLKKPFWWFLFSLTTIFTEAKISGWGKMIVFIQKIKEGIMRSSWHLQ